MNQTVPPHACPNGNDKTELNQRHIFQLVLV